MLPASRDALVDAARQLMTERDLEAVSSREVADKAGVSQALINYYFGGKTGLYEAMLEDTLGPVLEQIKKQLEMEADTASLRDLFRIYTLTVAANPWVPQLIIREVLSEKGRFRQRFIDIIASRSSGLLITLLEQARSRGELRADLDIGLASLSLLSLAVFPLISMPIASQVFPLDTSGEKLEQLIEHNYRLFLYGAGAQEKNPE